MGKRIVLPQTCCCCRPVLCLLLTADGCRRRACAVPLHSFGTGHPVIQCKSAPVSRSLDETQRGCGGFGSTGVSDKASQWAIAFPARWLCYACSRSAQVADLKKQKLDMNCPPRTRTL